MTSNTKKLAKARPVGRRLRTYNIRTVTGGIIASERATSFAAAAQQAYDRGLRDFDGADFRGTDLPGVRLPCVTMRGARLDGANINGANLSASELDGASMSGASALFIDLTGSDLTDLNATGAGLSAAMLSDAVITGAVFTGADLSGATMDGVTNILRHGCDQDGPLFTRANLYQCDFQFAKLFGASFAAALAMESNFRGAVLCDPTLFRANLWGADFRNARVTNADVRGALMADALTAGCEFQGTDLRTADLTAVGLSVRNATPTDDGADDPAPDRRRPSLRLVEGGRGRA